MKSVLNLSTSPMVFLISLIAREADSFTPNDSISFSIGGSGTQLNVSRAKPYHQIPEVAIASWVAHSA